MVQLNSTFAPTAPSDRKAVRRALLAARYQALRAHGTIPVPAAEREAIIMETVARAGRSRNSRGLSFVRIPVLDTPTPAEEIDGEDGDSVPLDSSRFAERDQTVPRGGWVAGGEPLLTPAERTRVKLDVEIARDMDLWTIGRTSPCQWLVVG